jgi:TolA-binding protein
VKQAGAALLLVAMVAGGCAQLSRDGWFSREDQAGKEATRALAEADAHAQGADYAAALAGYDAFLKKYPEDERVSHVRIVRTVVAEFIAVRAQLAALRDRMPAHDAEVTRLRQELTARQAEVARLREDLETLKRTDLKMERRRR